MANKKSKQTLKVALASTIAVTTAAGVVYTTPKMIKTVASEEKSKIDFILKTKNIDDDTIKVYIDNVKDMPKAFQFSIQLDGVVPKLDGQNLSIRDLIKENNTNAITTYSYNSKDNTIDVLVTSTEAINKEVDNTLEIFDLDVEIKDRKYSISPKENSDSKYLTIENKEYEGELGSEEEILAINSAPTLTKIENVKYIELNVGEKISLTAEELSKYIVAQDADNDELTFEIKDVNDKEITEFTTTTAGIYDIYVTASDNYGGKSETVNLQIKVNELEINPIITRNDKELEDVTINAGEVFNLMAGIKAVDALGNNVNVTVKSDKELNLDPDVTTTYNITYTAIDSIGRKTEKTITLTVKGNKAPVIKGYKDYTLTVGDSFNPSEGVTVEDEDEDIKLNIDSNVNTNIPGVYRVIYSATDSANKTTRVQIVVVVNPKMESVNSIPVIKAENRVIQLGQEFNGLDGVTAEDAEEGNITNKIVVVRNEVNNNVAGKYNVTYSVTDSKGASATKTITVIVNDPPKINAEDKTIKLGEEFNPLSGISATDKEDGNIADIEVIENTVDINKEGTYKVTYSVQDSLGGKATKTITVVVKKDTILAESIIINDKFSSLYVGANKIITATIDEKAELKDVEWITSDENIASIEVIGNDAKLIAKSKGKVTITAKTKDGSNKSDSITIDILEYKENVEDFISNNIEQAIESGVVTPVLGSGTEEAPLELEVQDIAVEKFSEFIDEIKELNPVIVEKYEEENFTIYKIKVKNSSVLSRIIALFKESNNDGYIYLKVANDLENADEIISIIDEKIETENSDTDGDQDNDGEVKPPVEDDEDQDNDGEIKPPVEDDEDQDNDGETKPPVEDDIVEIPGFIEDIIVSDVISKGEGNGSIESPLELEVKDVTLENFETFLDKLTDLNPVIVDKYVEGDYTIYKIKVENNSLLAKIMRLFREASLDEGYIYLKVSNNLADANNIIAKIDETIKLESSDGDNGNQGGNGGTETPDGDNGNQGGNGGTETPDKDNGNQGGNEETIKPDEDSGNQGQNQETVTPDKNEDSNGIKLPITGQESILGYVAAAIIAIGGVLFFYKKKK